MITVVNVIPQSLSGESNQDSEPNIAVNPANPNQVVVTAFTPDPGGGSNAPIFVSTNNGNTWALNTIVPSQAGSSGGTGDITSQFAGRSGNFYAGILRNPGNLRLNVLRTNPYTSPATMTIIRDRSNVDQPITKAATVLGGAGANTDRVYVGINDFNAPSGRTASIEQSLDAGATTPTFTTPRLERRTTLGQDGMQIRPAIHPDGTLYVAFYRWISNSGNWNSNTYTVTNAELIVVRDDNWGTGTNPFSDLVDASDGLAGRRVATGLSFPVNQWGTNGQDRWMGNIAIAIDPNTSSTLYVAYARNTGGVYTLHVCRSLDRGVNWSGDLRTISNAKNPALAINSQGEVAFAYQQLQGTGASQRWVTRLDQTSNGFTTQTTSVLATVPANAPVRTFSPYLGDYIGMMASGKDFYGVFCANNTPDSANFPNGVTYLRNANFTTNRLLDLDGITEVPISIDPFFFRVTAFDEEAQELYVRDWTDSPTSRDLGLEPSSNPWFFVNPDVWNRRSNAPGAFNSNDQPANQNPQQSIMGNNFAFARISRNATGTTESPTAHFLYSEFGTGSNYQNANITPDPTVTLAAGDLEQTMAAGYEWTLPVTTSTHLCLAVEINTANDPLKSPTLLGRAPGWPTTDLIVINDNNKAQRNMSVHPVPIGSAGTVSFYAIAHNAATFMRDMVLRFATLPEYEHVFEDAVVEIVDPRGEVGMQRFEQDGRLVLDRVLPGDNVWIGITLRIPELRNGEQIPFTVHELVEETMVNGFTIAPQVSWLYQVYAANIDLQGSAFVRVAHLFNIREFEEIGVGLMKAARGRRLYSRTYMSLLARGIEELQKITEAVLGPRGIKDLFRLGEALELLAAAVNDGDVPAAAAAHSTFANRLDAHITMLQKADGDAADIMQMVDWQITLYERLKEQISPDVAEKVISVSAEFIAAYQARAAGNKNYREMIELLLELFQVTADELGVDLMEFIEDMKRNLETSAASLQRAHRAFLIGIHEFLA